MKSANPPPTPTPPFKKTCPYTILQLPLIFQVLPQKDDFTSLTVTLVTHLPPSNILFTTSAISFFEVGYLAIMK